MFFPTSTSAMSIERISKAVPESSPLARTVFEIASGFSRTSLWEFAEPMEETIPSPTRARIVSSPAPPTRRLMFARTVTRAWAMSWMPSFAMAATLGVLITLGFTETCTASNTSRPAKVDGRSLLEAHLDVGLVGTDERTNHPARPALPRDNAPRGRSRSTGCLPWSPRSEAEPPPADSLYADACPTRYPIPTRAPADSASIHKRTGTAHATTEINPMTMASTNKLKMSPSCI